PSLPHHRPATSIFLCFLMIPPPPSSTLFPYTTLFRSRAGLRGADVRRARRPAASDRPSVVSEDSRDAAHRIYLCASRTDTPAGRDRKSTRLNSSHDQISYAVFCLKKKTKRQRQQKRTI